MNNKSIYTSIASQHELPLFFRPWWLDLVSSNWDAVVVADGGDVQAIWPYTIESKAGISIIRNPLMTPYLGPYFFHRKAVSSRKTWNSEDRIFASFWQQLPKWGFFKVECLPGYNNFLPFHHKGFQHTQRITYHISLHQDEALIFSNMKSSERSHIRQAEKTLEVKTNDLSGIEDFYRFHEHTLKRKGQKYPYSPDFLSSLLKTCIGKKAGLLLTARDQEDNHCASIFTVYDQNTMYLLISAINPRHVHSGAVALLIWYAIKHGKALELERFDFEGSMDRGIEPFFRSFGGDRISYLSCTSNLSRIWKLKQFLLG